MRVFHAPPRAELLRCHSNGKANNYGRSVFPALPRLLPRVWMASREQPDLVNTNQGAIGWYIDGAEGFTLKSNLSTLGASSYAIRSASTDTETRPGRLWILKPSHPHVGSGDLIRISQSRDELLSLDARVRPRRLGAVELDPERDWVVQPLVTDLLLWSGGRKFDCRFYAAIIRTISGTIEARVLRYGVARVTVGRHDPVRDPRTAITNISVQSHLADYDPREHMPLVYDDCEIVRRIVQDLIARADLSPDWRKDAQVLIIGLDVMFDARCAPLLVEVNHQPHIELQADNAESICGARFVRGIFGGAIPDLLAADKISRDWSGWDIVEP